MSFLANTLKNTEKETKYKTDLYQNPTTLLNKTTVKNTNLVNFGYLSQKHIKLNTFFSADRILCNT